MPSIILLHLLFDNIASICEVLPCMDLLANKQYIYFFNPNLNLNYIYFFAQNSALYDLINFDLAELSLKTSYQIKTKGSMS